MSRADSVIESFYEDANLRGSLTDDEADVLFQWAAQQAERLDASGADDAAFDALTDHLRQLVERINWTAGEGSYAAPEERAAALTTIAADAQAVGLSFAPPFSAQAVPAEPMEALHGLLTSLEPTSAPLPTPDEAEPISAVSAAAESAVSAPAEAEQPILPALPSDDEEFYDL